MNKENTQTVNRNSNSSDMSHAKDTGSPFSPGPTSPGVNESMELPGHSSFVSDDRGNSLADSLKKASESGIERSGSFAVLRSHEDKLFHGGDVRPIQDIIAEFESNPALYSSSSPENCSSSPGLGNEAYEITRGRQPANKSLSKSPSAEISESEINMRLAKLREEYEEKLMQKAEEMESQLGVIVQNIRAEERKKFEKELASNAATIDSADVSALVTEEVKKARMQMEQIYQNKLNQEVQRMRDAAQGNFETILASERQTLQHEVDAKVEAALQERTKEIQQSAQKELEKMAATLKTEAESYVAAQAAALEAERATCSDQVQGIEQERQKMKMQAKKEIGEYVRKLQEETSSTIAAIRGEAQAKVVAEEARLKTKYQEKTLEAERVIREEMKSEAERRMRMMLLNKMKKEVREEAEASIRAEVTQQVRAELMPICRQQAEANFSKSMGEKMREEAMKEAQREFEEKLEGECAVRFQKMEAEFEHRVHVEAMKRSEVIVKDTLKREKDNLKKEWQEKKSKEMASRFNDLEQKLKAEKADLARQKSAENLRRSKDDVARKKQLDELVAQQSEFQKKVAETEERLERQRQALRHEEMKFRRTVEKFERGEDLEMSHGLAASRQREKEREKIVELEREQKQEALREKELRDAETRRQAFKKATTTVEKRHGASSGASSKIPRVRSAAEKRESHDLEKEKEKEKERGNHAVEAAATETVGSSQSDALKMTPHEKVLKAKQQGSADNTALAAAYSFFNAKKVERILDFDFDAKSLLFGGGENSLIHSTQPTTGGGESKGSQQRQSASHSKTEKEKEKEKDAASRSVSAEATPIGKPPLRPSAAAAGNGRIPPPSVDGPMSLGDLNLESVGNGNGNGTTAPITTTTTNAGAAASQSLLSSSTSLFNFGVSSSHAPLASSGGNSNSSFLDYELDAKTIAERLIEEARNGAGMTPLGNRGPSTTLQLLSTPIREPVPPGPVAQPPSGSASNSPSGGTVNVAEDDLELLGAVKESMLEDEEVKEQFEIFVRSWKPESMGDRMKGLFNKLLLLWTSTETSFIHRYQFMEDIVGSPLDSAERKMQCEIARCSKEAGQVAKEMETVTHREEVKAKLAILLKSRPTSADCAVLMNELRRLTHAVVAIVAAWKNLHQTPLFYRGIDYEDILKLDELQSAGLSM
jgi:hypothetical protein